MKKRGFTLVELLAVIVVIGIIALIIVPNVAEIMMQSRKDTFEESARGLVVAAEEYYQGVISEEDFKGKTFQIGDEDLFDFDGKKPKGGTITILEDGSVEIYIYNDSYCAIKERNTKDITILSMNDIDSCGGDLHKPTVDGFVENESARQPNSIQVVASCSDTAGISHYEFMIRKKGSKEENWIRSTSGIYTFGGLDPDTEYETFMRCQNKNGLASEGGPLDVGTDGAKVTCTVTPNTNGWTTKKTVDVTYTTSTEYTKQYSTDLGRTWTDATGNKSFELVAPGSVMARVVPVNAGSKTQTVLCNVSRVDGTAPKADADVVDVSEIDKTLTVGAYCEDAESGIGKYEYAISEEVETDFDQIAKRFESTSNAFKFTGLDPTKKYYVYVRCTNGAGLTTNTEGVEAAITTTKHVRCEIDNYGYSNVDKHVTIYYPKGYTNSYHVTSSSGANVAKNKDVILENNKEYTTSSVSEVITVMQNADVYAKITSKDGNTESTLCSVNKIDKVDPLLTVTSEPAPGEYYYKDKKIIINVDDQGGSGIYSYYISKTNTAPKATMLCQAEDQNDDWVCSTDSTSTIERGLAYVPKNGPETYYVWVMDKAGNVSEMKSIVIDYIENTKPTCSLKVVDGNLGDNNYYTSNVTVEIEVDDQKANGDYYLSGVDTYGIYSNQDNKKPSAAFAGNKQLVIDTDGTNYIYGFVKDHAGNVNECTLTVKKDVTGPTCSYTGEILDVNSGAVAGSYTSGTWTNYHVNVNVNTEDKVSKVKSVEIIPSGMAGTAHVNYDNINTIIAKKTYKVTAEGESAVTAIVKDYAGNTTACDNFSVKEDHTTDLTFKATPLSLGTGDYTFTSNINTVTYYGGNGTVTCNPASSRKTGIYNVTCTATSSLNNFSISKTFKAQHSYAATAYDCVNCCSTTTSYACTEQVNCREETYCTNHYPCDPWSCTCGSYPDGCCTQYFGSICSDDCHTGTKCDTIEKTCYRTTQYTCTKYNCPNGGVLEGTTCYFR